MLEELVVQAGLSELFFSYRVGGGCKLLRITG